MGMQNMQTQQPMRQGGGKGAAMGDQMYNGPASPGGRPISTIAQPTFGESYDNDRMVAYLPSDSDSGGEIGIGDFMQDQLQPPQQPRYGQPSRYSNTSQSWDNATIAPQAGQGKGQPMQGGGKAQQGGKGQSMQPMQQGGGKGQSMYPTAPTAPATIAGNYPMAATNFQYNPNAATPLPVANTPVVNAQGANTSNYYANEISGGGTGP